jgi:hypothetical protein
LRLAERQLASFLLRTEPGIEALGVKNRSGRRRAAKRRQQACNNELLCCNDFMLVRRSAPIATEGSAEQLDFSSVETRAVVAAFAGGRVTLDAGALLISAPDCPWA